MQVSLNDFKANLAHYVEQAQTDVVELTAGQQVIARVVGVRQADDSGAARLLAAGVASWQGGKPQGAAIRLQAQGQPVSQMVLDDRR